MNHVPFSLTAAAAAIFFLASPAAGQSIPCSDRATALKFLADKYDEEPVARGLTNRGHMIELLASKDGDTWTLMVSQPNDVACLIAAGEGWRPVKPKPQGTAL